MGGVKGLPYDAEIEYLENTGSSYIDTGVYSTEQLSFEITLQRVLANDADEVAFGSRNNYSADISLWTNTASGKGFGVHYPYNNNGASREDSGWRYQGNITNSFHTVKVTPQNYSVDGTVCYTFQHQDRPAFTGVVPLAIFALKDGNRIDNRFFIGKISKVKIWLSDTLVRDYIPVRVGQVGYMYDKVSGQLFGNKGTGSFILGSDKIGGGKSLVINMLCGYSVERRAA